MTWVRRDDSASIHRKVAPLDDATYRLWSEAIEWSSRNATDGQIACEDLQFCSQRGTLERAETLVKRRLWHAAGDKCASDDCPPPGPDGWVIHDYFDYNPTAAKVREQRKLKAARQRRWREGKAEREAAADTSRRRVSRRTSNASKDAAPRARVSPPRPLKTGGERTGGTGALGTGAGGVSSPQCPRCLNRLDSQYHEVVCVTAEAAEA